MTMKAANWFVGIAIAALFTSMPIGGFCVSLAGLSSSSWPFWVIAASHGVAVAAGGIAIMLWYDRKWEKHVAATLKQWEAAEK